MIIRLWKTRFQKEHEEELVNFARNISRPYLAGCSGNQAVFFFSEGDEWITMTVWDQESDIFRMEEDPAYQEIVRRIGEYDALVGQSETKVYQCHSSHVSRFLQDRNERLPLF